MCRLSMLTLALLPTVTLATPATFTDGILDGTLTLAGTISSGRQHPHLARLDYIRGPDAAQ